MKLMVASDLSERSRLAVARALVLREQYDAELVALHVVDGDMPQALQHMTMTAAQTLLQDQLPEDLQASGRARVKIEIGDPFREISAQARALNIDLLLMGAHRRQFLKDIFTGTTIERVIRQSRCPVLMVNTEAKAPYQRLLAALDLADGDDQADCSTPVLAAVQALDFPQSAQLTLIHAYTSINKDVLQSAGSDQALIDQHSAQTRAEALRRLETLLNRPEFSALAPAIRIEEGPPFDVIQVAIRQLRPDLLVLGTHGYKGLKRLLLGSVADHLLRELEQDMLVVPVGSQ